MSRAASELAHLFRALKAPAAARALPRLADRAREGQWSYERFAEALLATEVASRDSHGGEGRIKAARFPARKTLEEFDFTFQRSVKKTVIEHLGQLDFLHARENVILLGPPGTGKTHLAIALSIRACLAGQRVQFATATQWVARLSEAKRQGSLETELRRLSFIPLIVVDEVGYIPFDPEAANLMFSLVSSRYERASMIVTSNKPFSAWGEIFGDDMAATAMIDRLIHHSRSSRSRATATACAAKTSTPAPAPRSPTSPDAPANRRRARKRPRAPLGATRLRSARSRLSHPGWSTFQPAQVGHFSTGLDSMCR
jgi:DNA replication protein DnaC